MNSAWHFVGGGLLILFGHLYLTVPLAGAASIPVSAGFLVLYAALVLTGLVELAVAFDRPWVAGYHREVGGFACIMFGVGAAPLALLDLADPDATLVDAAFWTSIAVCMPAVGLYYLRGGGSFGEES